MSENIDGYAPISKSFTIQNHAVVTTNDTTDNVVTLTADAITVRNRPALTFQKTSTEGATPLAGATFTLTNTSATIQSPLPHCQKAHPYRVTTRP